MWIALALAAATAMQTAEPASVGTARLAPNEVALHIVAHGEVTSPADRIVLTATITGKGPTSADALANARTSATTVTAALVAAGVDAAAITVANPGGVVGPPVIAPVPPPMTIDRSSPPSAPTRTAGVTMTITVADRAGIDRVTHVIVAQGQAIAGKPTASLRDDATARRAAIAAALLRARRDADDYAGAIGLRVARVTAVSNAAGLSDGVEALADVFERANNRNQAPDAVVTRAVAVVDYALVPR